MIDICSIIPAIRENNNPSKVLDIKGNKNKYVRIAPNGSDSAEIKV